MRHPFSIKAICFILSLVAYQFSFSQANNLMLPIGHTGRVYSAVYSPVTPSDPLGGRFILTGSDDKTMMLWSAEDGKLIKIYKGKNGAIKGACFSADAKELISGSEDGTINVWNIETAAIISGLTPINDNIRSLSVNPKSDEKMIAVCYQHRGGYVFKLNVPSYSLQLDSSITIKSANFSTDGKYLVTTAVGNPEVCIWETLHGTLIKKINVRSELAITAVFSAEGQSILTSSLNDEICIWDVKSGNKLLQLSETVPEILSANISTDGKYIATCSAGGLTTLFDGKSGKKITAWQAGEKQETFRGVANVSFSPDGTYLLTLCGHSSIKTWLTEAAEIVTDIKNHTSVVSKASYSPSGNIITTIHEDGSLRSWNANNGKLIGADIREVKFTDANYSPANTSMGSKYCAYSLNDTIAFYRLRTSGSGIQNLVGHHGKINSIVFSPDGKHILTSSNDGTAITWKVTANGNGEKWQVLRGHQGFVVNANYSPNGKQIITCSYDRSAIIWNAATGLSEARLPHKREVVSACFSPDSRKIITTCWDGVVRIWDAENKRLIDSITGNGDIITDASFSPPSNTDSVGGKYILTSGPGNLATIWDANTGKKLRELSGHKDLVTSAAFSPDAQYVVTSSADNFCKVWNAENGSLVYNFIAVGPSGYLVTDDSGRFDGSIAAQKLMHVTCGTEIIALEQFKNLSWEPGLASKLLGNNPEPITAKRFDDLGICNFTPRVIALPMKKDLYNYSIIPGSGGVGDVQVYVNNRLVMSYDSDSLPKIDSNYQLTFKSSDIAGYFIPGKHNEIEVKANTRIGNISSRGVTVIKAAGRAMPGRVKPNLYIVSIGISLYKGDGIKLNFASKDATDFEKAMTAAAKNLLNKEDEKDHVFSFLLNTEPGTTNWPLKDKVHETLDSIARKATSSDIIVIFFAGHGVLLPGKKPLYLLTAEATSLDLTDSTEKVTAISTDELIDWMKAIKAGKQVLILDACNSGQVIQNLQTLMGRGQIPADQQRALQNLQDKSGTFILSASASGQSAYESGVYNQGLLTYSLLSGLKFGNGLLEEKFVDLTTWFNSASSNVEILAKDIGGRQDPQIFGNASFKVGLVDEKLKEDIVLPAKKKVFGSTLLIGNIDFLNDSLGLSEIIDAELMNRNASGKKSKIAFAPSSKSQETYYIKGRYKIVGDNIDLSCFISEGNHKKNEFQMVVPIAERAKLGEKLVNEIEIYFADK